MKDKLINLQKKINIKFKNLNNLKKSITHKSYDSLNNYEKLEFLGDRILGFVISKKLIELYPNEKEGILDKKLASLVNKKKCCEISKKIGLENYILTKNINTDKNKIVDKIVSDACEALIGAIFLDQGLNLTEKFIIKLWNIKSDMTIKNQIDAKTKLQEHSLKNYKVLPEYKLFGHSGPKHKPIFKIGVRVKKSNYIKSSGNSKKDAEQKAATLYLKKLGM